ncbi:glycosidase [Xenococcus sp. PCC 7305]|uniref:alpha-amylase family glycosyl hydrolase n=1 Tax=Xenococcus sp. PCC 7305 TaxID=102125 RepID=UPI0002ABE213|nr:alpha-amylase family glycosyl hydrolase [Xenococcus sp. PCC 7305]ELS03199.1 glycosidase [Xenococcus sp. PCC 7305]
MVSNLENPNWWKSALIYHVYPLTFNDTNGDGVGDLQGIIEKIPYIKSLSADCLYLNPIFKTGMVDNGYDIIDPFAIDPRFGTIEDFQRLRDTCWQNDMHLMIDLVPGHTSDQHPYFQASCDRQHPDHATYRDWYIWADAHSENDGVPNNWVSYFNGSAWEYSATRNQYYLHQFAINQPNLNLHNEGVQQYLCDIFEFWAKKDVHIRLDAVGFMSDDQYLQDLKIRTDNVIPDGFHHDSELAKFELTHLNRPESKIFMEKLRTIADRYNTIMLAEVVAADDSMRIGRSYNFSGSGVPRSHLVYTGSNLREEPLDYSATKELLVNIQSYFSKGGLCQVSGNHDFQRMASRLFPETNDPHASVNYTRFISGLPGPYMHYYGDELGLRQTNVVDEIEDVDWAGRDGCRSPMPWLADAPNGGFTAAGVKPFLPVDPNFSDYAVDLQELDLESHLARIRAVFLERMNSSALQKGDFQVLQLPEPLVGYVRSSEEESLACLFNTSAHKYSDSAKGISLSGYECKLIDFGQINI